ncbi:Response regulator containing a CheY-like receiver domain and an HTH DNA-binding domain [Gaiella occulta]|uniref:Response regulator containing a CheY-like receiver domain and an HTH DNA-binding domain n=1 Tax=Gaiella occulta TaxID=1002870 RepID=A0A7M2Z2M8_9ACTN|nr:response regulator transcription factor [Gaiella occulta]RDI76272.1 Response regulator containing a CheY-like receiver domain and an HTH DNA-binding domain [Gaiella occulta]
MNGVGKPLPDRGCRRERADGTGGSRVTCLVADDHPPVLDAVSRFLAAHDVEVVGAVQDGEQALALIERLRPAVALVDVRMPRLGGIEVARCAVGSAAETAVILYTGFNGRALLTEALDAGARGVILKDSPLDDLVRAVRLVGEGGTYIDPGLAGALVDQAGAKVCSLTQREREVLRLLADGRTNAQIGEALFISAETVRTHVSKAMAKLGAATRTQAVAAALRESLIS